KRDLTAHTCLQGKDTCEEVDQEYSRKWARASTRGTRRVTVQDCLHVYVRPRYPLPSLFSLCPRPFKEKVSGTYPKRRERERESEVSSSY
ncbi:hypothetical protein TorRG33x02_319810, partial [Trema orientale]